MAVVEGGHHGLARASGGDDQVVIAAPLPFNLELLENLTLERVWLDGDRSEDRVVDLTCGCCGELLRLEALEVRV